MKHKKLIKQRIIELVGDLLKTKDIPPEAAIKIVSESETVAISHQLKKFKFSSKCITDLCTCIYENVNKIEKSDWYSPYEVARQFNL